MAAVSVEYCTTELHRCLLAITWLGAAGNESLGAGGGRRGATVAGVLV